MPSLSSLYLITKSDDVTTTSSSTQKKTKMIEFHEDQIIYKRNPLYNALLTHCDSIIAGDEKEYSSDTSSSS